MGMLIKCDAYLFHGPARFLKFSLASHTNNYGLSWWNCPQATCRHRWQEVPGNVLLPGRLWPLTDRCRGVGKPNSGKPNALVLIARVHAHIFQLRISFWKCGSQSSRTCCLSSCSASFSSFPCFLHSVQVSVMRPSLINPLPILLQKWLVETPT